MDDRESETIIREQLSWCIDTLSDLQNQSDMKAMDIHESNEDKGKALVANQAKTFYTDFRIQSLYELKHRKTSEIFKLRYELSKNQL